MLRRLLRKRPSVAVRHLALAGAASAALLCMPVRAAPPIDASPGVKMSSPAVTRIVVRFRSDASATPAPVATRTIADLRTALGRDFEVGATRRPGDTLLAFSAALSPAEAKAVLHTLRLRGDVLRADVERASRTAPGALARAKAASDAETVTRFIVTFADPGTRFASATNQKLGAAHDKMLSDAAGVAMRVSRATVGGAWVVDLATPVSGAEAARMVAALESTPGILHATPDRIKRAHAQAFYPDDTLYQQGKQWDLDDPVDGSYYGVDAPHAWAITVGSSSITAAVVDSGIVDHPDLVDRIVPGYDFITSPERARDGDARDPVTTDWGSYGSADECKGEAKTSGWHGSHVAGTIGASGNNGYGIVGLDWNARLMPVRVLGRCGSGSTVDITEGMLWAAGGSIPGVPANPTPARVINLSIGGSGECSDYEQSAYDEALSRGALVVVSAGNENDNADGYSPASCYGVSTVVATDPYGYRASYSNYSVYADIAAPGGDISRYSEEDGILSTIDLSDGAPSGNYGYGWKQGTSMAAPHVTGVGSLMLSVNPSLTPSQMKGIIADTSSYFASDSACRTDGDCGAGIVNAYYAVKEAVRMLAVPKVRVIEYYNVSLDHYFIAAESQLDVPALDNGWIPGWTRTGRTFNAYAGAESGLAGVCRFYIPPEKGNSHFYSAEASECNAIYDAATNPANPVYSWYAGFMYETGSAFTIDLPVDGKCPPTRVPVWRLWNHRPDTNHRYTTDPAIRDEMIARGSIDEGIHMCALP